MTQFTAMYKLGSSWSSKPCQNCESSPVLLLFGHKRRTRKRCDATKISGLSRSSVSIWTIICIIRGNKFPNTHRSRCLKWIIYLSDASGHCSNGYSPSFLTSSTMPVEPSKSAMCSKIGHCTVKNTTDAYYRKARMKVWKIASYLYVSNNGCLFCTPKKWRLSTWVGASIAERSQFSCKLQLTFGRTRW